MKTFQIALAIVLGTAGFASAKPYSADMAALSSNYHSGTTVKTLGRYNVTASGNFNSTERLEDGSASGLGSGPGGGSPNGN